MSSEPTANVVLDVQDVSKTYLVYRRPFDRLKQMFAFGGRRYFTEVQALQHASFQLRRGEALGVLGRNGAGKSTLLQLVAGTVTPTTGTVRMAGRVSALLELGSGFNPEFTGRENVFMNATILGLSRREIEDRFDAIASFADIGPFLDQPVKTYSSGMLVRLAFAVQVQVEPDVLIVDEAHALGVFGPEGRGLCAAAGVAPDVLVGTLGKALGAQGAFVCGRRVVRDWLWNRARSFVFSTGLSPALGAIAAERVRQIGRAHV